jgi:hypothetical protein
MDQVALILSLCVRNFSDEQKKNDLASGASAIVTVHQVGSGCQ